MSSNQLTPPPLPSVPTLLEKLTRIQLLLQPLPKRLMEMSTLLLPTPMGRGYVSTSTADASSPVAGVSGRRREYFDEC